MIFSFCLETLIVTTALIAIMNIQKFFNVKYQKYMIKKIPKNDKNYC